MVVSGCKAPSSVANLVKDRDFFPQKKQTTYDIDDNKDKDVIPDMLLKFPERNYIVDAKVSLIRSTLNSESNA